MRVAVHGRPRATGDLGIFVEATAENASRVMQALKTFGAPPQQIAAADFSKPGIVFQIGLPPRRIDILTDLTALTFSDAWADRVRHPLGPIEVDFIGKAAFVRNKRATGQPQDLADIVALEG